MHELRYRLIFGDDAGSVLAEHGHGYLGVLSPLVVLLCAVVAAFALLGVARGLPQPSGRSAGLARMSLACALALFSVYAGQELLEGALSTGHPGGIDAIVGLGGWISAPLCLLAGFGLALVLRLARAVARRIAVRSAIHRGAQPAPGMPAPVIVTPRACQLARRLAGRAPPLAT